MLSAGFTAALMKGFSWIAFSFALLCAIVAAWAAVTEWRIGRGGDDDDQTGGPCAP